MLRLTVRAASLGPRLHRFPCTPAFSRLCLWNVRGGVPGLGCGRARVLRIRARSRIALRPWPSVLQPARFIMSDEESRAKTAAAAPTPEVTLFDKIVARQVRKLGLPRRTAVVLASWRCAASQIPADIVYEDDEVLAFRDINPQAPVHVLVIPKHRDGLTGISKAEERHKAALGGLMVAASRVADRLGLAKGYRLVINDGPDGCACWCGQRLVRGAHARPGPPARPCPPALPASQASRYTTCTSTCSGAASCAGPRAEPTERGVAA